MNTHIEAFRWLYRRFLSHKLTLYMRDNHKQYAVRDAFRPVVDEEVDRYDPDSAAAFLFKYGIFK